MFSCEFYEISKNAFFTEHLWTTASTMWPINIGDPQWRWTEVVTHRCSVRKNVLKSFTKFTGKHLCLSLFFGKVAVLHPATLLKKRLQHRCCPVNIATFLRTPFLRASANGCFWMKNNWKSKVSIKKLAFLFNVIFRGIFHC